MQISDRRVLYLAVALVVVGAILIFVGGYTKDANGAAAAIVGLPTDLLGPLLTALGVALFITSRQGAKDAGSKGR